MKDLGTMWFIISLSGVIIMICFGIISFFLSGVVTDLKAVMIEVGKNKGRIELVEQKQVSDVHRIESVTQLELKALSENMRELTKNVNSLVLTLAKKGININV